MGSELESGLQLLVVGVSTVFAALVLMGIVVVIIARLTQEKTEAVHGESAALPEDDFSGVSRHTLVLLGAAATVAVQRPIRIRRVRFVSHKHLPSSWAQVGRAGHQQESIH